MKSSRSYQSIVKQTLASSLLLYVPLAATAYTSGALDVIDSGAGNDAIVNIDVQSLGGSPAVNSYIYADDNGTESTTYFGGKYSLHNFDWVTGDVGSQTPIMRLDETGVLELYNGGDTGNYVSLDAQNKQIQFGTGSTDELTLLSDSGVFKINTGGANNDTVITQGTDGVINWASGHTGSIPDDLTVGDAVTTDEALTLKGKLKLNHLTDAGKSQDVYYDAFVAGTTGINFDAFYAGPRVHAGYVGLGRPPGLGSPFDQHAGLYTHGSAIEFYLPKADDTSFVSKLSIQYDRIVTNGINEFLVAEHYNDVNESVLAVDLTAKKIGVRTYSPDTQLHVHGNFKVEPGYFGGGKLIAGPLVTVTGTNAHAIGYDIDATAYASVVLGAFNQTVGTPSSSTWSDSEELFVLGNGLSEVSRANAIEVLKNGQTTLKNRFWSSSTPEVVPTDPDASSGEALVVDGHTRLKGNVTMIRQGDIYMGSFSDVQPDQGPGFQGF